jgi:hypothetical protein
MLHQIEGAMYEKLRVLNAKVSTLALRIRIDLGNESHLAEMGQEAVNALLELTHAMEQYSTDVDRRLKDTHEQT